MIRIYGERVKEMMFSRLLIFGMLLLLITAALVLTGSMFEKQRESKEVADDYEEQYGEYEYYWFSEGLDDFEYYSYMDGDENGVWYKKLSALNQSLWEETKLQYYTCNPQILSIKNKIDDIFLYGYEDGYADTVGYEIDEEKYYSIKSLIVSRNFFTSNKISLQEGREFFKEDYENDEGKKIPVVLGNAYGGYYKIGDSFSCNWFGKNMILEVVGILGKNSFYLSSANNEFVSTERYVLLPALKVKGRDEFSRFLSLVELNGTIKSNLGEKETREILDSLFQKQGLDWSYNIRNPQSNPNEASVVKKYGKMTKQIAEQYDILVGLVVCFSIIALLLNIFSILQKNKYNFGVELLCGARFFDVLLEGIGLVASVLVIGDGLTSLLFIVTKKSIWCFVVVQLVVLTILVVSVISCYFYIKRMQIGDMIGGGE